MHSRVLNEMQDKLARGRYDRGKLDDVIGALQRVLSQNGSRAEMDNC